MQPMVHTMQCRRKYNANIGNENDPAEQRIEGGKYFSWNVMDLYYRSHPAQYHRGIVNRVKPICLSNKVIPKNTEEQTNSKNNERNYNVLKHPLIKGTYGS